MKKYEIIISIVISGLILIGVYFLVDTIVKTKNQTVVNTQNIQGIVDFLNRSTPPK